MIANDTKNVPSTNSNDDKKDNSAPFKVTKSKQKKWDEIQALGYQKQNDELIELGFRNLSMNLKYLKLFNGDVKQIVQTLEQRYTEKENKKQQKKAEKKDKEDGSDSDQDKKKAKKVKKIMEQKVETKQYTDLPSNIKTIYLDGNNMLFVIGAIRTLTLKKKARKAELAIAEIAYNYMKSLPNGVDIVLIYDHTTLVYTKEVEKNSQKFKLSVCGPVKFNNSDDELVLWAEEMGAQKAKDCLFVTSDRELQHRLTEQGVDEIMKPGRWFEMVKKQLTVTEFDKIVAEMTKIESEEKKEQ